MKRLLVVSGLVVGLFGAVALANPVETPAPKGEADHAAACAAMMRGEGVTAEGRAELEQFMESGAMERAMKGMMEMARGMGGGDPMRGMVRMMEMMGSMGGMRGPSTPQRSTP
ncbi:MAG: hypothetical protein ACRDH5_09135 [bacterium]